MGFAYFVGRGVEQSDALAVEWFWAAAAVGHAQAQFNIGIAYQQGLGVEQDNFTAVAWFRKAALKGGLGGGKRTKCCVRLKRATFFASAALAP